MMTLMASIRTRSRKDGSVYYSVLWRADGRQTSISVDELQDAEHIQAYLHISGGVLPPTQRQAIEDELDTAGEEPQDLGD